MDGRPRVADNLDVLVARNELILVGVVAGEAGTRTEAAEVFETTYQDYTVEAMEVVKGQAPRRLVVTFARTVAPVDDPKAMPAQFAGYRPLEVGDRYVFFLERQVTTGQWIPGFEPWRFRVTDKVRVDSALGSAGTFFPEQTLPDFLAAVKAKSR